MAMDFKNLIFNHPKKAILAIFIVLAVLFGTLIMNLWNNYAETDLISVQKQLEATNNFLISNKPIDTTIVKKATEAFLHNTKKTVNKLYISIYDTDGNLLYTNTSQSRNNILLSFKQTSSALDKVKQNETTNVIFDKISQKNYFISTAYNIRLKLYIVSECIVNKTATFTGFLTTMSTNLVILFSLLIISIVCILMLNTYINNIIKLKKYLLTLDEEDNKNDQKDFTKDNVINQTEDLYTHYKNKIDIIRQHDYEREQAINKEKAKMDSKRALANNLSHEVKTPIGIIIGYLDTLINHPDIDNQTRISFLNNCLQSAQRLQNMIVNIAVIIRLEDGGNNIALERTDINKVANLAKEDLKFTLNEYGITFKNETETDIFVTANEMLLYNVFCNLIKNSCYYSSGSEITLKTISQDEQSVTFSFYDNGQGVPSEVLDKLFNRFYRIEKDKNDKSGTGLGLSIVKESINLCGGTISVSNRINQRGLEFTFTLPTA